MLVTEQIEYDFALAIEHVQKGSYGAAKELLEGIVQLDDKNYEAYCLYAKVNFYTGDHDKALEAANIVTKNHFLREQPSIGLLLHCYWIKAQIFYSRSQRIQALRALASLTKLVEKECNHDSFDLPWPEIYLMQSKLFMFTTEYEEAIEAAYKGMLCDGGDENSDLYFQRAKAYLKASSKHFDEAYQDLLKVEELRKIKGKQVSQDLLPLGFDIQEITTDFEKRIDGENLALLLLSGKYGYQSNNRSESFWDRLGLNFSIIYLEKITTLFLMPNEIYYNYNLVELEKIKKLLEADPVAIYLKMARAFLKQGKNGCSKAIEWATAMIRIDKNNLDAYCIRAEAKYLSGDLNGSISDIDKLSTFDNLLLDNSTQHAEMEVVCKKILDLNILKADILQAQNKKQAAHRTLSYFFDYHTSLEVPRPISSQLCWKKAQLDKQYGRFYEVVKTTTFGIKRDPTNIDYYDLRAHANFELEKTDAGWQDELTKRNIRAGQIPVIDDENEGYQLTYNNVPKDYAPG